MDIIDELAQLCDALNAQGVDFALCGGLAMAVYAFPRATLDIDIMVQPEDVDRVKQVARRLGYGIEARPTLLKGGAIDIRRLTELAQETDEHLALDLLVVTPVSYTHLTLPTN